MTTATRTTSALHLERTHDTGPILVATSGRDGAQAFQVAKLLAERLGSATGVLAVLEPLPVYAAGAEFQPLPLEFEQERRQGLVEDVRRTMVQAGINGTDWPVEILYGSPAGALARAAAERRARLLVVNLHHHRPFDRLLVGEAALQTIRRADRPVLAAVEPLTTLPRAAVVGMDFSPASVLAAQSALELLAPGGTLYLVHVWTRSARASVAVREHEQQVEAQLPRMLARAQSALTVPPGVTVTPVWLVGLPAEELIAFAVGHDADLIAVGRHGHRWLERLLVGSVTTAVVRESARSVLVVPDPGIAELDRVQRYMNGTFSSSSPEQWDELLDGVARRNRGRLTHLETDDPASGVQVEERGYAFAGASYDRHDRHVALMFARPGDPTTHLTRIIGGITGIGLLTGDDGADQALRVGHGDGQTLLTFTADAPAQPDAGGVLP